MKIWKNNGKIIGKYGTSPINVDICLLTMETYGKLIGKP